MYKNFSGLFVGVSIFLLLPLFAAASVVINEIAWMGTANSATDEWIELYNSGSGAINLEGWRLMADDGSPDILLAGSVSAGGYFLMERRTNDKSAPGMADLIYTGALENTGEVINLLDTNGVIKDTINASEGWPAGDNTTKETMQRAVGGGWITAAPTPKKVNAASGGNENAGSDDATKEPDNSWNTGDNSGGSAGTYVPPENLPRITASAGSDTTAVVGEEVQFQGAAWGLQHEQLENARYLWNFGDGATQEGRNVGHVYRFPGTYTVRVTVSSGKYTAFDDMRITVGENKFVVNELAPGQDGWIEFFNGGNASIHVGRWIVETASSRFVFPLGTTVAPRSFVVLSLQTANSNLNRNGDHVYLFYPNGSFANGLSYVFQIPAAKSVSKSENGAGIITDPTPGKENSVPANIQTKEPVVAWAVAKLPAASASVAVKTKPASVDSIPNTETAAEEHAAGNAEATVFQAFQKKETSQSWNETMWFGGSLVAGGLLAVGFVLIKRKKMKL